jgi:hypothetical chaperone protein
MRRMLGRRANEPVAYGIDFGTTNSTIAAAYRDRVEVIPVESEGLPEVLPSIIYLNRDRNRAAGQEAVEQFLVTGSRRTICGRCDLVEVIGGRRESACHQYRPGGGCHDARLISGIKSDLSETDFVSTHSWATDFTLTDLVTVIMRRLKIAADRATAADVRRVVLGHPVVFVGAEGPEYHERQALAEQRIRDAAVQAGFNEVVLLEEPAAAVINEDLREGYALAADFGGGTFDVAVIRFASDGGDVVALAGVDVGGEMFDRLLFKAKVAPALHLNDSYEIRPGVVRELPNLFKNRMSTLSGLKNLLSDPSTAATLSEFQAATDGRRLAPVDSILYSGYAYHFYQAIEQAKIQLSAAASTSIEFHRPGIDVSVPVQRDEFEQLISESMAAVRVEILRALKDADVAPENVSLVLRTGGSSSIPAFARILEEIFDPSVIQERPVYTTVAHGLAMYALGQWT